MSAFATGGCSLADGSDERGLVSVNADTSRPVAIDNAVVVEWNQIAFDAALAHDGFQDFAVNLRAITLMHLAVHDAINSIAGTYARHALTGPLRPQAHPSAAAAQAAHGVLVAIYPAQQPIFDSALAKYVGIADEESGRLGVELGREAAAAIISNRRGDGWDATGSYAPDATQAAGAYQFVPPFDFVFRPDFADAKPFGIGSGTDFRAAPPPELDSPEYASAYQEVKALGPLQSSARSADQSHLAQWWYEFSEMGWNRIANLLVRRENVALYPAARLFALVNLGIADAYVAVWNAKRHYATWRPHTAIRAAGGDGNSATEPEPTWEPFCVTPPVWEYPSAHAMQSAAAAEMLVAALGRDGISFAAKSTTAPAERPERSFESLQAAAAEAADSRVMCGIHFRFATEAGLEQGRLMARAILAQHLRPSEPAAPDP